MRGAFDECQAAMIELCQQQHRGELDMEAFADFAVIFLLGMLAGVIAMLAVDEYHSRVEDAEDY